MSHSDTIVRRSSAETTGQGSGRKHPSGSGGCLSKAAVMMIQPPRHTLTKRERVSCRCRPCPARAKVTPGRSLRHTHLHAAATASRPVLAARSPARSRRATPTTRHGAGGKSVSRHQPSAPQGPHRGLGLGAASATGCESRSSIRSLGAGKTSSSPLGH
jgi:hypothetical protein